MLLCFFLGFSLLLVVAKRNTVFIEIGFVTIKKDTILIELSLCPGRGLHVNSYLLFIEYLVYFLAEGLGCERFYNIIAHP